MSLLFSCSSQWVFSCTAMAPGLCLLFLLYSFKPRPCCSNFINYWNYIFCTQCWGSRSFWARWCFSGEMQIPWFNYCSGQVSWFGVFPRKTALALAVLLRSPPLLCSTLHLRCFLILFWTNSLKSKDFPSVCFALLGQGLLLQSLLLQGN